MPIWCERKILLDDSLDDSLTSQARKKYTLDAFNLSVISTFKFRPDRSHAVQIPRHAFNLPCDFAAGFYFIVCKLQVVEVTNSEVKMGIAYRAVKTHTQHKQGLRAWPCREHLLTYLLLFSKMQHIKIFHLSTMCNILK